MVGAMILCDSVPKNLKVENGFVISERVLMRN